MSELIDIVFERVELNQLEKFISTFDFQSYDLSKSNYTDDNDTYYDLGQINLSLLIRKESLSSVVLANGRLVLNNECVPHVYIHIYIDLHKEGFESKKCSVEFNISTIDIDWFGNKKYWVSEIRCWGVNLNQMLRARKAYIDLSETLEDDLIIAET